MKSRTIGITLLAVLPLAACSTPSDGPSTPAETPTVTESVTEQSPTPAPDLDPATWVESAITATSNSSTFTMLGQYWMGNTGLPTDGQCTTYHIDYAASQYQMVTAMDTYPISDTSCDPPYPFVGMGSMGDRFYPNLYEGDLIVIEAPEDVQREYWDSILPWDFYRGLANHAVNASFTDDGSSLTMEVATSDVQELGYLSVEDVTAPTMTFTIYLDDQGRIVRDEALNVAVPYDQGVENFREVFIAFDEPQGLVSPEGMSWEQLGTVPATGTATSLAELEALIAPTDPGEADGMSGD